MMTIPLTHKQSLFAEFYIQTGGSGRASAKAAGDKGNTATLGAVASS
jgi:phage terminase small subunit